ncbi:MAG TPA: DinB family protein [Gemmatimonadaceae bacterium]|nr:DinB family protein [Gemmatimonadaceae bacterium]
MPEAWLRGPIEGVDAYLQPAAHALVQAREDLDVATTGISREQLWTRPGGAASLGYHLRHLAGSLDRLLTYARGAQLDDRQQMALKIEMEPGDPPEDVTSLVSHVRGAIEAGLTQLRATRREELLERRVVGRKALPSTVLGLLFHAAEHTTRHVGQAITTAKIVSGRDE